MDLEPLPKGEEWICEPLPEGEGLIKHLRNLS